VGPQPYERSCQEAARIDMNGITDPAVEKYIYSLLPPRDRVLRE